MNQLQKQLEIYDSEIQTQQNKKKKDFDQIEMLENTITNHKFHIKKLEQVYIYKYILFFIVIFKIDVEIN